MLQMTRSEYKDVVKVRVHLYLTDLGSQILARSQIETFLSRVRPEVLDIASFAVETLSTIGNGGACVKRRRENSCSSRY